MTFSAGEQGRNKYVRQTGEHSADKIKDQIAKVANAIFDVIAEDEKKKHVAEDVRQAAMHEHRSDQRQVNRDRRWLQARHLDALTCERLHQNAIAGNDVMTGNDLLRHGRKGVGKSFVAAEPLQENKDQHVDKDKDIINYRRRAALSGGFVCDWKKHLMFTSNLARRRKQNSLSLWERAMTYLTHQGGIAFGRRLGSPKGCEIVAGGPQTTGHRAIDRQHPEGVLRELG